MRATRVIHRCGIIIRIAIAVITVMWVWCAEGKVERSASEIVEEFCNLDTSGKRLTPAGAEEIARKVLLNESPVGPTSQVVVIKDYSIRRLGADDNTATFAVDYHVLAAIGPSLELRRKQVPYSSQPVVESQRFSLVLSNTRFELDENGSVRPVKELPQWRIKTAPQTPHVSIMAAISYVRTASYRVKDPLLKARAQETVAALDLVSRSQFMPASMRGPSQQMPEDILFQYIRAEMEGAGLNPHGSAHLDIFLVHPVQWQKDKIGIAREFQVKRTSLAVNKAEAYVEYAVVGELDSRLRFSSLQGSSVTREGFQLVFDDRYPPVVGTTPSIGPSRWRIDSVPAEQWISVATAVQYVTQTRDTTIDALVKDNANKALAGLMKYSK